MRLSKNQLNFLRNKVGLNKEIIWSSYNQLWTVVKGPISIFFIIKFLLPDQQGLWFTFINLAALKIFAELGFTMIITQYVSHEYASINSFNDKLGTNSKDLEKFVSLIRFSLKFYIKIIPLAILIMVVVGYFYFLSEKPEIFYAWIFNSVVGGSSLLVAIFQGIYKGIDKVKTVQKNIFLGSVIMGLGNWGLLILGFNIWALVIGNFLGVLIMGFSLYYKDVKFWKTILEYNLNDKYDWFSEIMGLQWRYAISWASGYFIFNLIVPVLYKYESAEIAGEYGLTMRVVSAFIGISQAWITTKIPQFNFLVAKNMRIELDNYFKKSFTQSLSIQILFSSIVIIGFYIFSQKADFIDRFLSLEYVIALLLIQIPMQIVNCLAIYLRAFKKEPYVVYSILNAIIMVVASFIILPYFGFDLMITFLVTIYWIGLLPYGLFVYKKKKKEFSFL